MTETKYWIWLEMVFGIASPRIWEAMESCESPVEAYEKLCSGRHNMILKSKESENIKRIPLEKSVDIIDICCSKKIEIVDFSSDKYPEKLKNIYNPPVVLFYKGNIEVLNTGISLAMVGARKASPQSIMIAKRLSRELTEKGFIISSGFAVGIDINSHLSAVDAGGITVCVMGCGLDVNYPKENFIYREKILRNNGVFISEFFPGTPSYASNFYKRNRILSGISNGTIIIQAGYKSGSLVTGELSLEQGREVFCVPPADIYDKSYAGNIKFLRDGAIAVYGCEDIIDYYKELSEDFDSFHLKNVIEKRSGIISEKKETASDKNKIIKTISDENDTMKTVIANYDDFSDLQKKIISILENGRVHVDVISEKLGYNNTSISDLMIELMDMELEGIIKSFAGKVYGLY
ncbi:MAG: DNA-processing protein DprA [Oscillospiraceae bacterium]|nr:DNA-processing protein DprA [Oscillospiraceae bacterium]